MAYLEDDDNSNICGINDCQSKAEVHTEIVPLCKPHAELIMRSTIARLIKRFNVEKLASFEIKRNNNNQTPQQKQP
jgi:hypothetical protein